MWRFAVAYKLEDRDASLVTQLVLATAPSLPWSHESVPRPGWQVQSLEWQLEEPAPGLLAQLTVKTRLYATGLYWQTGVFLRPAQQPATQALITLDTDNPQRLQLTVQTAVPSLVFGELIGIVRQLLAARWKGLTYQELLRCPTVLDATIRCSGLFQMAEVNRQLGRADPKLQCSKCSVVWEGAALLAGGHRPPGDQLRHGELVALADQSLAGAIAGEQLAAVVRAEVLAANRPLHDKLNRQADYISDLRQGVGRIQHGQTHGQLALHALLQITMDHYRAGIARPKLFTWSPPTAASPACKVSSGSGSSWPCGVWTAAEPIRTRRTRSAVRPDGFERSPRTCASRAPHLQWRPALAPPQSRSPSPNLTRPPATRST